MAWDTADQLIVKEHLGLFKAASNYDIYDLDSGEMVLECREPHLSWLTQALRFTDYRRMTPFDIHVTDMQGNLVVRVVRGISLFLSKVKVYDGEGALLGGFEQKLFSIGGAFNVHDEHGRTVCQLAGKWTGWEFKFTANGVELARVSKKWAGIHKEMFTTADSYALDVANNIPPESAIRKLILAAVLCIDMVLKE
ncbi:phospholipid scramblase-related protein [Lacipirellula parvula]|uniref:RNAase n=1 Tax=Lacipirellula parvula TaxID=2650471 RepID=A0A5K7XEI2_9BACT|nr:phospholipid scramblase-related protein [Lacipirellula parvula]BBO32736.1 hypothetical protein PLANPX_2348 [Lacipirellula parvula]